MLSVRCADLFSCGSGLCVCALRRSAGGSVINSLGLSCWETLGLGLNPTLPDGHSTSQTSPTITSSFQNHGFPTPSLETEDTHWYASEWTQVNNSALLSSRLSLYEVCLCIRAIRTHLFPGAHRMQAGETTEMRCCSKCQLGVGSLASQHVRGHQKWNIQDVLMCSIWEPQATLKWSTMCCWSVCICEVDWWVRNQQCWLHPVWI